MMRRFTLGTVCVSGVLLVSIGSCEGPPAAEQVSQVNQTSSDLYTANGITLWNNNNLGTGATVPVCFVVRPILQSNGNTRCPLQSSNTDCNGNTTSSNGRTFSSSFLRQYVRANVEDNWMRNSDLEFLNWGDCAIDPATNKHIENNLIGTIMIHFLDQDVTDQPLGKRTDAAAHIQYNWDAIQGASDHDLGNVVHEFGHALGFEHEWLRPDWKNWKCVSGYVASAITGQCLEVEGFSSATNTAPNGSSVQLSACQSSSQQTFSQGWQSDHLDGTIQAVGKCLDVVGGGTTSGTKVQIWDCNQGANQQWVLQNDRTFKNPQSGKCLDVPSGLSGTQLQIYDCGTGSNQHWSVPGNGITSGIDGNKCVTVAGNNTTNGTPVQISDCNRTDGQSWTQGFDGTKLDGTLRAMDKCLDVIGGGTANGTKVQLNDCIGGANQQWALQTNGSIVGVQSGRCLDDAGGNTTNGTQLQIFDCNGGSNQKWGVANNDPGMSFSTPADVTSIMQYCVAGGMVNGHLGPWDVIGLQRAYGRKYRGSLVGYRGQCANVQGGSTTAGTSIIGFPCRGGWNDTWFRSSTATNEPFQTPANARCLNVANGTAPNPLVSSTCTTAENERFTTVGVEWRAMGNMCVQAVGGGLQLQTCNGAVAQKWNFFHPVGGLRNDQIQSNGTNLCVSASTTTGAVGQNLILATCSATDTKQRFSTPGAGLVTLTNNTGVCANVFGGTTAPGSIIGLWNGCTTTNPASNSQFALSGKIKSLNDCMTTQSPADPGNLITDAACDANNTTTQIWDYYF